MSRTALIAGASGLVGGHLLGQLLEDGAWDCVLSIGRREVELEHPRLQQRITDFADPSTLADLSPVEDAFCCLGTTIRKAGSRAAFRAIDHDAVIAVAQAVHTAGARRFLHVTALGASPRSRVFYNRVKGETERDVAAIGFASAVAFRPSILDGDRPESRLGEQLGLVAMRTAAPLLGKYRPTHAEDVASAMVAEAKSGHTGSRVVPADEIARLAS